MKCADAIDGRLRVHDISQSRDEDYYGLYPRHGATQHVGKGLWGTYVVWSGPTKVWGRSLRLQPSIFHMRGPLSTATSSARGRTGGNVSIRPVMKATHAWALGLDKRHLFLLQYSQGVD
jgi:hypothetical protein